MGVDSQTTVCCMNEEQEPNLEARRESIKSMRGQTQVGWYHKGYWLKEFTQNLLFVFMSIPGYFQYCSSIEAFEVRHYDPSRSSFIVQDCFSYPRLFGFPYKVEYCSFKVHPSVFMTIQSCFHYCNFIIELDVRDNDAFKIFFIIKDCFGYPGFFFFL